tara:strand:- start:393 stop:1010 length:618 start_codon:yes stop_codon:yes gene_type:complete
MKTDTEQEELLPVPLQVSTPVEPVEGNMCESGDAREEVTERYRGTRTQLGVNCPDMNDDKLSKELVNLRCILLFLGDYSVLYTFFFLGRSFHGMSTNFFSIIWGTTPYVVSWVLINYLFGEKSAYGDDYRRKVEDIKMISAIGVTLKCTVLFVPLGTVFHAVWRMHFMLHVFTTFMLNAFLFMNFGILLWRFCFLLAYKICFYFS